MRIIRRPERHRGFTVIELLVVIGIIVLLVSILLPVVSQVRLRAHVANTTAEMQRIASACQLYYNTFHAYPGPVSDADILLGRTGTGSGTGDPGIGNLPRITSSENLVLGLFGYLLPPQTLGHPITFTPAPTSHDPLSLNPLHPGVAGHFMDWIQDELTPLPYTGTPPSVTPAAGAGMAQSLEYATGQTMTDSQAPEFIDKIPSPMPILYVRARAGAPGIESAAVNPAQQYNHMLLQDYGSYYHWVDANNITRGMWTQFTTIPVALPGQPPADQAPFYQSWLDYFQNPSLTGTPKGKDTFILISAGPDRTYGTQDDIIVTP